MAPRPELQGFVFSEKLGSGSYATVYKAYRKGEIREAVAIKCVEKSSLSKSAVDNLVNEIALLKKLNHDYIVNMKDFQWDTHYIYIIMEYCSGGDLSQFVRSKRCLPERVCKRFLQQLGKALEYLRKQNISHMDLKPQNILLSSRQNPVLKVGDFGFAQYLRPQDGATSLRGSPLYMAPEILLDYRYDARVDLWSVGVILYECLFGRAPYSSKTFTELAEKIKSRKPIQIPYGVEISHDCRDLLQRLLQHNPDQRIMFEEFFTHPFLDLEHIPSADSYEKAVALVLEAVEKDSGQQFADAVRLYGDAIQHFLPALEYEQNAAKRAAMRHRVEEYINRAEELKARLKPASIPAALQEVLTPYQELVQLSGDDTHMLAALKIVEEAERLENEERYESALKKYELALGALIPILCGGSVTGRRHELLQHQLNRWMSRAEAVKTYVKINSLSLSDSSEVKEAEQQAGITDSLRGQCSVQ